MKQELNLPCLAEVTYITVHFRSGTAKVVIHGKLHVGSAVQENSPEFSVESTIEGQLVNAVKALAVNVFTERLETELS